MFLYINIGLLAVCALVAVMGVFYFIKELISYAAFLRPESHVFQNEEIPILILDPRYRPLKVNPAAKEVFDLDSARARSLKDIFRITAGEELEITHDLISDKEKLLKARSVRTGLLYTLHFTSVEDERHKHRFIICMALAGERQETTGRSAEAEAGTDFLTSLWNRRGGERLIQDAMSGTGGCLAFVDLDNLKYINDIYGHLAGDLALKTAASVLRDRKNVIASRIGGDEFLLFMPGARAKEAEEQARAICQSFETRKGRLKETSLSIGLFTFSGKVSFEEAREKADKALYHVKQNGKSGYYFYREKSALVEKEATVDLQSLMRSLELQGQYKGAFNVNNRAFANIYYYITSVARRSGGSVNILLITIEPKDGGVFTDQEQERAQWCLNKVMGETLRNVDVSSRFSATQYLVILTNARRDSIPKIMERVFRDFRRSFKNEDVILAYDSAEYAVESQECLMDAPVC